MSNETQERDLQEIGVNAYASIVEMVAALECDYERLEELRDQEERDEDEEAELKTLLAEAGECESREDAEERIREDALSVEVRSGWVNVGEEMEPEDFTILLCTGGPAVRILGELDGEEPRRAWLEVQDWFTPWTQYIGASQETLLTYARCFYFGG